MIACFVSSVEEPIVLGGGFTCTDGVVVQSSAFCNGVVDCPDCSDEYGPNCGEFDISNSGTSYSMNFISNNFNVESNIVVRSLFGQPEVVL